MTTASTAQRHIHISYGKFSGIIKKKIEMFSINAMQAAASVHVLHLTYLRGSQLHN